MTRSSVLLFALVQLSLAAHGQQVVTTDIANFWKAYDSVLPLTDSLQRIERINQLYIGPATDGLKSLIQARNYQDHEFADAMANYPKYWNSIRASTLNAQQEAKQIEANIAKLREHYPELRPATVYFSFGAFRSGGTYLGNKVLLGSEFLFAQQSSAIDELPERIQRSIKEYAPQDIPLIATHEYVHTQQKPWEHLSIIERCLAEGVAEFVSTLVTGKPLSPPVAFGKQHPERVLNRYMEEIFRNSDVDNWLWSTNENELKVNDLGYYIGYQICELYYTRATDKKKALKDLIELEYTNEAEVARIVDGTGFLPMTIAEISAKYVALCPTVGRIMEFENGSQSVSPSLQVITVEFSDTMSECCRSMDHGTEPDVQPLKVVSMLGWNEDHRRFSFAVETLSPDTSYELIISNFAKADGGNRTAPYSIRFKTAKM